MKAEKRKCCLACFWGVCILSACGKDSTAREIESAVINETDDVENVTFEIIDEGEAAEEETIEEVPEMSEEDILVVLKEQYNNIYADICNEYEDASYYDCRSVRYCFSTDDSKKSAYAFLIEEITGYIEFVLDYSYTPLLECTEYIGYDANVYYMGYRYDIGDFMNPAYSFPSLSLAYSCLAGYYLKTGDYEACVETRKAYADFLNDTNIASEGYTEIYEDEDFEGNARRYESTLDAYGRTIDLICYRNDELYYEQTYQYERNKLVEYHQTGSYSLPDYEYTEVYSYDDAGRIIHIERDDVDGDRYDETEVIDYEYDDGNHVHKHEKAIFYVNGQRDSTGEISIYGTVIDWE